MGFQHPHQRDHMMRGLEAATRSPKTPAHLIPHLQKRLGGNMATVKAKQGTSGASNGLPDVVNTRKAPPPTQTMVGGKFSAGEQSSTESNLKGRASFQRTNKLATRKQPFKSSSNLAPKKDALYGEF